MTIDYSALLYDPVYAEIGVDAVFTAGTAGPDIPITVIDDTRPKTMVTGSNQMEVRSVRPGPFARVPELAAKGISQGDYRNAVLSFNGRDWLVYSFELRGSPNGEDLGQVRFLLSAIELSTDG